jgi:bifunctional DNA-binding transcriptional regulator/antitoxin component of YhaV-PrlF toxin-antitoxin module
MEGFYMMSYRVPVAADGRIVMPKACREALHLTKGGEVLIQVEGHEARICSLQDAVKNAQALVKKGKKNRTESLTTALFKMRRDEAIHD